MLADTILKRRLLGWCDLGMQWGHLRAKDLAWLQARRAFQQRVPQLLNEHEWIFVVGCNNSGTTLIHDVLASTGKFSFMPHEGQRYTNVLRRARKKGHQRVWTEYLEELQLNELDSTSEVPRLLFDWLREIGARPKPRIIEKTTANAVRMRWLQRAFPRAAFIGVVRNGYAVVEGIKRKGNKAANRGARHWKLVNEIMLDDAPRVGRFLMVRYEDFVTVPHEVLPRLARFLDLPNEDLEVGFARINGSPTASSRTAVQNMNAASIQRLSQEELQTITREAGELLSRLGYSRWEST
jgi:Sulfotransferase family